MRPTSLGSCSAPSPAIANLCIESRTQLEQVVVEASGPESSANTRAEQPSARGCAYREAMSSSSRPHPQYAFEKPFAASRCLVRIDTIPPRNDA